MLVVPHPPLFDSHSGWTTSPGLDPIGCPLKPAPVLMISMSDGQAVYMWMIGLIIGKILHKSGLISLTHVHVGNKQTFKNMYYKNINYTLCVHTRIYYTLYFLLCTVCTYSTLYCAGSYCGLAGLPCPWTKVEGV